MRLSLYCRIKYIFLGCLVICSAQAEIKGGGINSDDQVLIEFGHVVTGATELKQIRLCPPAPIPDINHPSFSVQSQVLDGNCVTVDLGFTPGWQSCDYLEYQQVLDMSGQTIILQGVGVSPEAWQANHSARNWRYAGAITHQFSPYNVAVTDNGNDLAWLGRNSSATTDSFTHHQLNGDGGFRENQCVIHFDLDQLNKESQNNLKPFRGENPSSGIATVSALSAGLDYFLAAQSSGFFLSYQAGRNQTCSINADTFGNGTRMEYIDFFSQLEFGGSPRFCQSGPCLSANGTDCDPADKKMLDECSAQLGGR